VTFFDFTSFPAATGLAVFSDFDGTIAHPDTLNFLTETFSSLEFRQGIGRKIATGELSLRDGIQQEVATIRGSLEEVLLFLKKHVEIDSAFAAFADWCFEQQIPLTILSAGIKEVIEDLLRPCQLKQVKILANPLQIIDGRWSLQFLDETPWGHDKASAVRQAKADGFYVVYLGDGLSDRGAARSADRVFAKGGLARYCAEEHIRYTELIDFSLVKKKLMHFLQEKGRKH
jgi:2,3-diketo-5-methylthio-1-phosphopentane phosphatase